MEVITKSKLHELAEERLRKFDTEIVENIVRMIYEMVVRKAREDADGTTLIWNVRPMYIFEGGQHVREVHLVRACQKLQELFPDSIITHEWSVTRAITVDWT